MAKLGWGTPHAGHASRSASSSRSPATSPSSACSRWRCRPRMRRSSSCRSTSSARIEFDKQRLWFFAAPVRVAHPVPDARRRAWDCSSPGATTRISCCPSGGFHPRFNPPPLPFPAPQRIAISMLNTDIARIRTETLFRGHVEHRRSSARRRRSCFGVDVAQRRRTPRLRRAVPVLAVPLHHRDLRVAVAQGVRRRAVQHPLATSRSKGPTPWRAHGTGSISLLLLRCLGGLRHHLGRDAGHHAAADRR